MTIIKAINEKGTDRKSLYKKKDYLTADSKTNGGKCVLTVNCISPYVIEEMLSVKRIFHKSGGRCWFEYVISPTPDIPSRANEDYLELAKEVADLFPGFQCLCVLHLDSKIRHLHFMFNSVSIRDGKKYQQSPSGLQTFKQETNDILRKYDFDICKLGINEILDTNDYSDAESFEYLEIDEGLFLSEVVSVDQEIDISEQDICIDEYDPVYGDYPFFQSEGSMIEMTNTYNPNAMAVKPEAPASQLPAQNNTAMVPQTPQQIAEPSQPARPTLSVHIGRKHTVHHPAEGLTAAEVASLRQLCEPTIDELNNTARMAITLSETLAAKGLNYDVAVYGMPQTESFFGNNIQIDPTSMAIDADFTIEGDK